MAKQTSGQTIHSGEAATTKVSVNSGGLIYGSNSKQASKLFQSLNPPQIDNISPTSTQQLDDIAKDQRS